MSDKEVIDVEGMLWSEVCEEHGQSADQMFHRYNLSPEMLTKQGKLINFTGRGSFTGNIVFDKDFVLQKLAKQINSLGLVAEEDIDALMSEVKDVVVQAQQKERENKLQEVRKQLEDLRGAGIDEKELAKILNIK